MSSVEQLWHEAAANPPAPARLEHVQRRAARRSLTRNALLTLLFLAAPLGIWLAWSTTEPEVMVVAAEDPGTLGTTPSEEDRPTGDPSALPEATDLDVVQSIGESAGSALAIHEALVELSVIPGLDLVLVPTSDGRQTCLLTVTESDTAHVCTDVGDFEANGIHFWLPNAGDSGGTATVVAVPPGTVIGEVGDGVSSPRGTFHVWPGGQDVKTARLVDGRLSIDLGFEGDEREYTLGSVIRFGPDCEIALRVYNGSGRSGLAGRLTEHLADQIFADDIVSGAPLEPQNTELFDEDVTWLIDGGLDCADLTLLGLPTPTAIQRPASPVAWAAVDPEWLGENRVAIVLGTRYSEN